MIAPPQILPSSSLFFDESRLIIFYRPAVYESRIFYCQDQAYLFHIFRQIRKTDVVNDIASPDQQRLAVFFQQLEVVGVSMVAKKSVGGI